jgi:ferredoxin-type protein NapH
MKGIRKIGLVMLVLGIVIYTAQLFSGPFVLKVDDLNALNEKQSALLSDVLEQKVVGQEFDFSFQISSAIGEIYEKSNEQARANEAWDDVLYDSAHDFAAPLVKEASLSPSAKYTGWILFLTFGLSVIGGLMYILPGVVLMGPAGIKNDHVFHQSSTNKVWIGWIVFGWLVSFYVLLYFFPDFVVNWVLIVDPVSELIKNKPADRWFLYGLLYCTVMTVMAIRMYVKYRNNKYQILRTSSVLFFQIAFAFLIPEIMSRFNMPGTDFKNIWPLDYDFFFGWNLDQLIASGTLGIFMLVWGIVLILVAVPVFVYFFGKRWYCSWVCGCGGLAETLGDPYRQLSDKSLKAWQIERYLIHGVLVFAVFMTGLTLYTYFSGTSEVLGIETYTVQKTYGFLIGSVFAGVIGTGFYPVMGSRVWCRFGCPLAAYLGLVQKFKSRFRITTNGGQCISCGNCSTYCEMGIDVRAYAQKGQNIVRSSCVGCGVCAAVCPRGVLKLENGPDSGRVSDDPIIIGLKGVQLSKEVTE